MGASPTEQGGCGHLPQELRVCFVLQQVGCRSMAQMCSWGVLLGVEHRVGLPGLGQACIVGCTMEQHCPAAVSTAIWLCYVGDKSPPVWQVEPGSASSRAAHLIGALMGSLCCSRCVLTWWHAKREIDPVMGLNWCLAALFK